MLKRKGIPHHVLNAKIHEREAEIVAQAGRYKAVTISTNMAGRGTDILLGGNPAFLARILAKGKEDEATYAAALDEAKQICEKEKEQVIAQGGLHILGTERHESRRIDNQLRGRSGQAGRPGLVALLRLPRRRDHAHLRVRPHLAPSRQARDDGGHAHRAPPHHEGHRECPDAGWRRTTSTSGSISSNTTT